MSLSLFYFRQFKKKQMSIFVLIRNVDNVASLIILFLNMMLLYLSPLPFLCPLLADTPKSLSKSRVTTLSFLAM